MQQIWRDEEHNSWAVCEAACSVVRLHHRDTSEAWHAAIQAAMHHAEATAAIPKVFFSPAYARQPMTAADYSVLRASTTTLQQHCYQLVLQCLS